MVDCTTTIVTSCTSLLASTYNVPENLCYEFTVLLLDHFSPLLHHHFLSFLYSLPPLSLLVRGSLISLNPLPTIGNSLKKQKSLYKVLMPIKPPYKFLRAYGSWWRIYASLVGKGLIVPFCQSFSTRNFLTLTPLPWLTFFFWNVPPFAPLFLSVCRVAIGVKYFKSGNHGTAMKYLSHALDIDPGNVEGLVARGALWVPFSSISIPTYWRFHSQTLL